MPDHDPATNTASAHNHYFLGVQAALREAGIAWPVLVLDRERLHRNAGRLQALLAPGQRLRLVEKSLPVPQLLSELMQRLQTDALMVFHEPQLRQVFERFPQVDVLIGKPMPVAAARHFYRHLERTGQPPPTRLQWLVDTPERLSQYAALAQELGLRLDISIEIDVGLHRGGVEDAATMQRMLTLIDETPTRLRLAGLMGYDAHVGKLPGIVQSRERGFAEAVATYRSLQAQVCDQMPTLREGACWNGAGSPTVALHGDARSPLNDVSVGSALLKPSDFDIDLLSDFEPALFVATPVLKRQNGLRLPGPAWFSQALVGWWSGHRCSYFIYGGGWPARVASPATVAPSTLYGTSYNQAIFTGPRDPALSVDDVLFLRPHQSEGSLLHFGAVCVMEQGRIVERWEPFGE